VSSGEDDLDETIDLGALRIRNPSFEVRDGVDVIVTGEITSVDAAKLGLTPRSLSGISLRGVPPTIKAVRDGDGNAGV